MSSWAKYNAPNLGLLFNKRIYNENVISRLLKAEPDGSLTFNVTDTSREFDAFFDDFVAYDISSFAHSKAGWPHNASFELKTIYPGLFTGSGYTHDTKALGDFKIGFYFNHTSGLPVIPASSVKGVLRQLFECDKTTGGVDFTGPQSLNAVKFILQLILVEEKKLVASLVEFINTTLLSLTIDQLKEIKDNIFGFNGRKGSDIFFDAVITGQEGRFIGKDFITPHENPLKNPKPLQFLKVLPGITFLFSFELTNNGWLEELKKLFFKYTLLTTGIGAKTNVGYGQFEPVKADVTNIESEEYEQPKEYILPENVQFTKVLAKNTIAKAIVKGMKDNDSFNVEVFIGINSVGFYSIKSAGFILQLKQVIAVEIKGVSNSKIQSIKLCAKAE